MQGTEKDTSLSGPANVAGSGLEGTGAAPVSFTVLIPNYNHAELLPEALESVLSQSSQPEAIVVVDDASTDNSLEVIRGFLGRHPRIRLIQREQNRGVLANLNDFLSELETSYVLPLGADDYVLPGYFEGARKLLERHPSAGICTTETVFLNPDGSKDSSRLRWSVAPAFLSPDEMRRVPRCSFLGQCFYHRAALREIGGFQESLRWNADYYVSWVLAARHGAGYLPATGTAFRVSPNSFWGRGHKSPEQQAVLRATLQYLNRPDFADVRETLRQAQVLSIYQAGVFSALWNDPASRYFLTPSFVWHLAYRRIRPLIRHPIPAPLKRFLRKPFAKG